MNVFPAALGLALFCAGTALAAPPGSVTPAPGHAKAGPPTCVPQPHCVSEPAERRLYFPAQSLSYDPTWSATPVFRGLRLEAGGSVSLTVRRPPDFDNGEIIVSIFHQVDDDSAGDIWFAVTPVGFNHLSSFESYGSTATNAVPAPETLTILHEQSAVLFEGDVDGGYGWPFGADWWYFEISRQGSFEGPLTVMSVSIDY